ncbi:MAG: type II CAAX prenyl endopeptidase Rce1 family protein [Stenomitos frigidus ULC029]
MPSLLEELGFRVLLLPHPTEFSTSKRWIFSLFSWLGFMAYHLHPLVVPLCKGWRKRSSLLPLQVLSKLLIVVMNEVPNRANVIL